MALLVTQIASATAAVTWMAVEWLEHGRPSVLGIVTGAVAGLVAITPASGTAGPPGALGIGVAAGLACYWGATRLKRRFGYDDSLDAFGVHAVGGIVGALLTGLFAARGLGGVGLAEGVTIWQQLGVQALGVAVTAGYSGILSLVILKLVDALVGLRVSEDDETRGLDLALHSEQGYNLEY
jgi:Amt family ammonium transporter